METKSSGDVPGAEELPFQLCLVRQRFSTAIYQWYPWAFHNTDAQYSDTFFVFSM